VEIELSLDGPEVPDEVYAFLREADTRVDEFVRNHPPLASGFAPSDFVTVYRALRAVAKANLAPGNKFCEWGCGFGVATSLAAMLEFDSVGIEIDSALIEASRRLADDFALATEFVQGSFIPPGGDVYADELYAVEGGEFFWLVTDADHAYEELGLDADDFDLIFAYPWPSEENIIESLFERYAAEGALLLTYRQFDSVRLSRKIRE